MLSQILQRTPPWVWLLLIGLIVLGYSQIRSRTMGLRRIVITPVVMVFLSLYGTVSVFGPSPIVLCTWLAACALLANLIVLRTSPKGTGYDSIKRQFIVPGSWFPLFVIMGIFFTKYAVGVTLALDPAMAHHTLFATFVGLIYGLFSGFFAGCALRLIRLTQSVIAH